MSEVPKRLSMFPRDGGTSDPSELVLGVPGFEFADLFVPERLGELHATFDAWFKETSPDAYATFGTYRVSKGEGMTPQAISESLLAASPFVSAFVGRLFNIEAELLTLREGTMDRAPLWRFRREIAKKRILRDSAGKAWREQGFDLALAQTVATRAIAAVVPQSNLFDEELRVARGALVLHELDDVARKVQKGGGAAWTDELRARAKAAGDAVRATPNAPTSLAAHNDELVAALALDAIEAWIAARRADKADPAARWPSLHAPHAVDYANLVQLRRPEPALPEAFVGPADHVREREGFVLTDRRGSAKQVEEQVDYCLYCHDRDKDSCSKGMHDPKTNTLKKNPLGVPLTGCPLDEKISEMHTMRGQGDSLAALALVCIDNPMCPGTGHRICNDCMKACIFQKQEPVDIPQIETRVLTEILALPWGLEIYGFLTRWNPLNIHRPYARPYAGKNVLVVGLGPAGYTLAHHLACEGFGVAAVDGLKIEPLPESLVGTAEAPPRPVRDFQKLYLELDERVLLGFGGVSEYGITVRWDKNFLTVLYATLARNRNVRVYGGVRFGGTVTLDDAWALGFDHVALAAGAGKPTIIDMKNNLARGIRKASDFLMGLQLTGAYKKSSLTNLQVSLPALVIGGGLTAIDTATELLAYYVVQVEKTRDRIDALTREKGEGQVRKLFDDEEWATLSTHLAHAKAIADERAKASSEGRAPRIQRLIESWGGVSVCYRKTVQDSPAYRLNHEEVVKGLEEGIRFIENVSPDEAVLDERGHVKAIRFIRKGGEIVELPARTVCVAAGTSPNVTYEHEYEGSFALDAKRHFFQAHRVTVDDGELALEPTSDTSQGFFTSYLKDGRTVSFYGDNHPHYAGSVVKAMASAKDGYHHVVRLFPEIQALDPATQPSRDAARKALFARLDTELKAEVVAVNRLTPTIVEVVVHAPLAARKFKPGQFYRLQNFESLAPIVEDNRLAMEGLALTGAWIDEDKGLLGTIVLEMGASSRLCAALRPGEPIVLMGPTGAPTEIEASETVLLCGGGLGNAVLFSIARAFKALGSKVLYFAGYRNSADLFKQDDIERYTDQVIWATDAGSPIEPRRPQDRHFRGNIVQAMVAYASGKLAGEPQIRFAGVSRIIAIGSDRMMNAVREARHGVLAPLLNPRHLAIGSINSPMQCMMKEICAQCLQKHIDPVTKAETVVFTCSNQDQELDRVDFNHLRERLRANSMQEKLADAWLHRLLEKNPDILRV